ncbi:DMT family transporter [Almyronema epifaneia]|uniref:EamA family transporter n=1 Tax=Almyronema epifaneia S1 TaxID=2991925 RepID=A0ABW6IEG2_9CYAN
MGQRDDLPNQPEASTQDPAAILRELRQDLDRFQQQFSGQLLQDIDQLQARKSRLMQDIEDLEADYEALQADYQALQTHQEVALSKQQQAQQQVWAKRLAQALASHLQTQLSQTVYTAALESRDRDLPTAVSPDAYRSTHNIHQLLTSLDSSLSSTLQSLQQDLNSYQSGLNRQISRMHSLEKQGEVILEALVGRLNQKLQQQINHLQASAAEGYGQAAADNLDWSAKPVNGSSQRHQDFPLSPRQLSRFQKGLALIFMSTLALSFHNVLVKIIGGGARLFNWLPIDQILPLNVPNALLLLFLRMLVVLPLMGLIAQQLYPPVWQELSQFLSGRDRRAVFQVIGSGFFLFTSQILIYKSIPEIGPGVAVTLLFMYPLITVPLAWFLFGDRPTALRGMVMVAIAMGICMVSWPTINSYVLAGGSISPWGIGAALLSSVAFALYLISMQISFRKLHPVPVTLMQFTTILVLTGVVVAILSVSQALGFAVLGARLEPPTQASALAIAVLLLGVLTLVGYLFNNYGVRLMGAAKASIVASSGPVVTAVLAAVITPGIQTHLQLIEWVGILLVTLGVAALSFERMAVKQKPVAPTLAARTR